MILMLTSANGEDKIRISVRSIESWYQHGKGTFIRSNTGHMYSVRELPEQIDKAIIQGSMFIKKVDVL